jgi:hypothetical protein
MINIRIHLGAIGSMAIDLVLAGNMSSLLTIEIRQSSAS